MTHLRIAVTIALPTLLAASAFAQAGTSSRLPLAVSGRQLHTVEGFFPLSVLADATPSKPNAGLEHSARGYLRGAVTEMLVGEISVPSSLRRLFEGLDQTTYEYLRTPEALHRGPRYAVFLNYGRNYEPWIGSARLLGPAVR